jgi:hypothetical protein
VNFPLPAMHDIVSNTESEKSEKISKGPPQHSRRFKIADSGSFIHHTLGIWDLYIEKSPIRWRIPLYPLIPDRAQFISDLGYLWRAIWDLSSPLLFARLAVSAGLALSPAASLWCVVTVAQ